MKKLILSFLLLSLLLLTGCTDYESKYDKLQEEYDELLTKYESINSWYYDDKEDLGPQLDKYVEAVSSTEDYIVVLYEYFEEQSVSFDEAYDAYDALHSILHSFY